MSTTIKMWAVFDPEGNIVHKSIRLSYSRCVEDFAERFCLWHNYLKNGYTCRPVRVTIEELPQGEK